MPKKIENYMTKRNEGARDWVVTRREFLAGSAVAVAGLAAGLPYSHADRTDNKIKVSFGVVTDAHYADVDSKGTRKYKESLAKMTECVELMNAKKVDFLVELGDFKDQGKPATEKTTLKYLSDMEEVFAQFKGARYHVLGNHDVDSISKEQFLTRVENTDIAKGSTYYSFDSKGFHFIVLDANYKADGSNYDHGNYNWTDTNIPPKELNWLSKDLSSSTKPAIVFVHQQLDVAGNTGIKNAVKVRQVLQNSKRVLAVFQGHHHPGHYSHIEGIHYYTLKAMVERSGEENNSYGIVDIYTDNRLVITGYRKAVSKKLEKT